MCLANMQHDPENLYMYAIIIIELHREGSQVSVDDLTRSVEEPGKGISKRH